MFSSEFCEIFKNTFFTEHVRATASDCCDENDTKNINSVSPDTPDTFGHVVFENANSNSTVTDCFIDIQIQNGSVSIVNTFHGYKINFKLARK